MDCVTYMCFYSAGMLGLDVRKASDVLASENKKRKAKNSYIHNGADKKDCKMKRYMYFTKRDRVRLKKGE